MGVGFRPQLYIAARLRGLPHAAMHNRPRRALLCSLSVAQELRQPMREGERMRYAIIDERKRCSRCRRLLPLDDFPRRSDSCDGRQYICKWCMRDYMREYMREYMRAWRANKKEMS